MSNNELLAAISDMMDTKLEPITNRLDRLEHSHKRLEQSYERLEQSYERLEQSNERLEQSYERLEQSYERLEQSYERLEQSQRKMELTLENNILPRLQTIEDCYLSTFERYQSGVGQIETMQNKIDVIETVIKDHSDKIHKLA